MNEQINLRLPKDLVKKAKDYTLKKGYYNIQDFIRELIREKLFDEPKITKTELKLIKDIIRTSEDCNLFGSEEEMFKKLRKKQQ